MTDELRVIQALYRPQVSTRKQRDSCPVGWSLSQDIDGRMDRRTRLRLLGSRVDGGQNGAVLLRPGRFARYASLFFVAHLSLPLSRSRIDGVGGREVETSNRGVVAAQGSPRGTDKGGHAPKSQKVAINADGVAAICPTLSRKAKNRGRLRALTEAYAERKGMEDATDEMPDAAIARDAFEARSQKNILQGNWQMMSFRGVGGLV